MSVKTTFGNLCAVALSWVLVPLASAPAFAYEVAPIVYELQPSGSSAATMLRITNSSDKPLTIEITADRRTFDSNGVESRTSAEDDFLIFPPQAVVPVGKAQAIRVQYVGDPALRQSVSYLVTVRQVPIKMPSGVNTVQVVYNFATLANVVPRDAKPDVKFVGLVQSDKGPRLHFRNSGARYGNLVGSKLVIGDKALAGEEWRKALGSGWIMPGMDRYVPLPAALGPVAANTQVRFEYIEPQF